jgi:UDP-N-acetylmuramoylalanine--D-glutamate ligase
MIRELEKADARILVIGLGYRTGLATANFLRARGFAVEVSDTKRAEDLAPIIAQLDPRVIVHGADQSPELLDRGYDLIVLSPGVPASIPLVAEAGRRGIRVIAEVELAWHYTRGGWACITGTDGKSTTTAFTAHLLRELGLAAREGGNIGIPLISLADSSSEETITVAELSSFQLETVADFHADAALITNLQPDHLDRYDGLDSYFSAKMRIARNQTAADYFIYNGDDPELTRRAATVSATVWRFSLRDDTAEAYWNGTHIVLAGLGPVVKTAHLQVLGSHNIQNCMSALLLARAMCAKRGLQFPACALDAACASFAGLPHRMEPVGVFRGRRFINDSKATTVGAVSVALASVDANTVFILGGRGKGDDYSRLAELMRGKVRGVVLIGETRDEFRPLFAGFALREAASLDEAIGAALELSQEGDTIVLSPACASFDMFRSYEHRGDEFREAVRRVAGA